MFTELNRLLSQATTILIIAAPIEGGRIRLTITPKSTKADSKTVLVPLTVDGTPQELDAGLPAALENFTTKSLSLIESSERFDAEIEAAKKEKAAEAEAARKARSSKSTAPAKQAMSPATPATPPAEKPAEPSLFSIEEESSKPATANT